MSQLGYFQEQTCPHLGVQNSGLKDQRPFPLTYRRIIRLLSQRRFSRWFSAHYIHKTSFFPNVSATITCCMMNLFYFLETLYINYHFPLRHSQKLDVNTLQVNEESDVYEERLMKAIRLGVYKLVNQNRLEPVNSPPISRTSGPVY